jgi:hypothetical protein
MKMLLGLIAALMLVSAQAEELKFGDLNYFLKQGQMNLAANAVMGNETSRFNQAQEVEVDGYFVGATFSYALKDNLNAFVGLDYLHDVRTDIAADHFNTSGMQNPKLGANLRLLNQNDAGFNFDVGAMLTVKLMDRELGNASAPQKDGDLLNSTTSNHAEHRHTLDLNARVGKKWNEANEVYFLGGVTYHHAGDVNDLGSDSKVPYESSMDLKAAAFYQYRPVHEFMMTLGLAGTRFGEFDGEGVLGNKFTTTSHIDFDFLFNAKYLITENFIAKFMMGQDKRSNYEVQSGSTDLLKVDRRQSFNYGLGVDFLF